MSYYEADAYARWRGARLPDRGGVGMAAAAGQPGPAAPAVRPPSRGGPAGPGRLRQLYGVGLAVDVERLSALPRLPARRRGAVGEYNGKFMVNQQVLRGSAAITPPGHARLTYRNFFPPGARWPMTGVRLARTPGGL